MPTFGADQAALIQQMIDSSTVVAQKMGTVISRETATARAIVSFDGSSGIGQPVKCFETVVCGTGDRVGMVRVEAEWVIVGNYTIRTWADEMLGFSFSSSTTNSSSTFVDMPSSPTVTFTKARDATQLQVFIALSCRSGTTTSVIEIAGLITFPDGTTLDQVLFHRIVLVSGGAHLDMSGGVTTALTLPAGAYAVTGRWRLSSGTGVPTIDSNDTVTISVREVAG